MNTQIIAMKALRDRDFLRACRAILADADEPMTTAEVARRAAQGPAPSFYITFDWALRCIRLLRKRGCSPGGGYSSRLKYAELVRRVDRLMLRTGMTEPEALSKVLAEGKAPSFYLTEKSAFVLYCRLLEQKRLERSLAYLSGAPGTPRRHRH